MKLNSTAVQQREEGIRLGVEDEVGNRHLPGKEEGNGAGEKAEPEQCPPKSSSAAATSKMLCQRKYATTLASGKANTLDVPCSFVRDKKNLHSTSSLTASKSIT
ncbi:hypothetical protein HMPREF9080_02471, partial [Cardiobacterium valvarum F0432]